MAGFLSYVFFKDRITLFPSFIHAWTQSDRYALALGFLANGFDFFHPQTFNLVSINGITQVDFPVHEYIVALIMKLSGAHEPVIFRSYVLIYGLAGLFFLFRMTKFLGGTFFHGLFVSILIMTCPVFTYYLDGFLPSIPSFANVIIGYYFFFRYKKLFARKDFIFAIIFFTLAALARTPFVIFLFAVFCQQVLEYFRLKKINWREMLVFASGFVVILSYFFYNLHLGEKYGTQFLAYLLPAKNIPALRELFFQTIDQWRYEYFTKAHYFTFILLFASGVFLVIRKKLTSENKFVLTQSVIALCGAVTYFFLMTTQFPHHDYYFIDAFYPVLALFLVYLIPKIQPSSVTFRFVFLIAGGGLLTLFSIAASNTLDDRYTVHEWDRTEITRQNFEGAGHFLDSIGIPASAKVLVLDAYTTNTPLILMNRKGYTLLWTSKENIDTAMKKDFDYVIMQNCFVVSDIVHFDPEIVKQLEKVADNGSISIYKRLENNNRSLEDFLGIKEGNIIYRCYADFEQDSQCNLFNVSKRSGENHFDGNFSFRIDADEEFNPTFSILQKEVPFSQSTKVLVRTMVLREDISKDIDVVASVNHGDEKYFYQSFSLNQYAGKTTGWKEVMFQFVLPGIKSKDDKLSVYFWNKDKNKFYLDDFSLVIYR